MKEVERLDKPKSVEFTHYLGHQWIPAPLSYTPNTYDRVIYLGADLDKDIFAAYRGNQLTIYKGHLNSGKY